MRKSVLIILILLAVIILSLFYYNYNSQLSDKNRYVKDIKEEKKADDSNKLSIEDVEESPIQNKNYDLQIKDFAFSNNELRIKKGDSVTWTNLDTAGHTITSDSGEELNSKLLSRNENYQHTFNEAGIFNYHCTPHPYMKGTIVVE